MKRIRYNSWKVVSKLSRNQKWTLSSKQLHCNSGFTSQDNNNKLFASLHHKLGFLLSKLKQQQQAASLFLNQMSPHKEICSVTSTAAWSRNKDNHKSLRLLFIFKVVTTNKRSFEYFKYILDILSILTQPSIANAIIIKSKKSWRLPQ